MAYTQQDLVKLERAIAAGIRVVRYADRIVEYQSMDDMRKARIEIAGELGIELKPKRRRVFRTFVKGNGY